MPTPHPCKQIIAQRGLTQRAVASIVGYHESDFARIINGYVEPGPRFRARLADLLAVPEADLFRDSNDLPAPAQSVAEAP